MSMHSPVVFGETSDLRAGIENMLSSDKSVVSERMAFLDKATSQAGLTTTFGAEIEFALPEDPLAGGSTETEDLDALYAEVAIEICRGVSGFELWDVGHHGKGEIVTPAAHPIPVMLNATWNGQIVANDDEMEGIIEIRTAPADPVEAVDRYWRAIQAIGTVAARHGRMGMILSTHMNAAVDESEGKFIDFGTEKGGLILAAVQRNLVALNPLQLEAGIEEGINVLEAFPDFKDASTTVHENRLELRHPDVGLADPRIDILSVLIGVYQASQNSVPASVLAQLHPCSNIWADTASWRSLGETLRLAAMLDTRTQHIVTPAYFSRAASGEWVEEYFDDFVTVLTHGMGCKALDNNAAIMRQFVGDLRFKGNKLDLRSGSPFYGEFAPRLKDVTAGYYGNKFRVLPHVIYDSPDVHLSNRRNIARSSIVRSALGPALDSLTDASTSVDIRNDLVKNYMVHVDSE